ncbi:uncharacterized protein LOC132748244 [Ruditapes philippinarum]|uniref:uncharacterized protein LOC132748244 n=1 Tax=Ruditapes philippinarum TaxID=129788 RepID=UPI00295C3862|nr:uncharacterized protein LOC132748244 [Ruditapes philippinarum]
MAKGYAIGGLSGFLYMWTVKKFSELRGGKDDGLNHFLGGFGVVAPYAAVYKRNFTFFMLGGFFAGIIAMSTKTFAQMEYTRNSYMDPDRQVDQYTRYPEIFVAYHVRKERHEAKQRLKELNETS